MSLYEVSKIVPGECFLARDLIRGGDPILIHEQAATESIKLWDRLAMRVVELRGKRVIGGGLLPFDMDLSEQFLQEVEAFSDEERDDIGFLAPGFTALFLEALIGRLIDEDFPDIVNKEGDEIQFIRVGYRFAEGVTGQDIRDELAGLPELETAGEDFWNLDRHE